MEIILATNNKGKLKEVKEILYEHDIKGLKESNIEIDVIEDKETFYENALKKSKEIYEYIKKPVIADDSGLCIDILDDFPGVYTHRFLGEEATDDERNNALIEKVKDYENEDRNAKVVCVLVYYDGKNIIKGEGILRGKIAKEARGTNGFGFDPIFELENNKTLAELTEVEKNNCSARYLAATDLKNKLKSLNQI